MNYKKMFDSMFPGFFYESGLKNMPENPKLESDWERILSFHPKRFFYAHAPEVIVEE